MADPLPVVPAREDLRPQEVVQPSRYVYLNVAPSEPLRPSVDETVPIESLSYTWAKRLESNEESQDAITDIVSQMSGPGGYIERLIVDQDGEVIEGKRRLEALKRLGISEVPITRILDPRAFLSFHTDQSNLPAVIDAAAAASHLSQTPTYQDPRIKGKGQMFRGIGSLMRRRMFPIIQAAQLGWKTLTPEQRQRAQDFLNTPVHEFAGMEKAGIEYFKDLLGLSPAESEGGIMALSDFKQSAPVYRSLLAEAVENLPMEKGSPDQMRSMLVKSPGVKLEELHWRGLDDFLKGRKSVTKKELSTFLQDSPVVLKEVVRSDKASQEMPYLENRALMMAQGRGDYASLPPSLRETYHKSMLEEIEGLRAENIVGPTKHGKYTLPGAAGYREVLLTFPRFDNRWYDAGPHFLQRGHWDETNVLSFLQTTERSLNKSLDTLHLEAIQSDWHQKARKLRKKEIEDTAYSLWEDHKVRPYIAPEVAKRLGKKAKVTLDANSGPPFPFVAARRLTQELYHEDWLKNKDRFIKDAKKTVPKDFGYRTPEYYRYSAELREKTGELEKELQNVTAARDLQALDQMVKERVDWKHRILRSFRNESNPAASHLKSEAAEASVRSRLRAVNKRVVEMKEHVPDAPFKKTWHELSFRRALRLAAEEGKAGVSWTPGDFHVEQFNLKDAEADGMRYFYDTIIKDYAKKFGKPFGAKVELVSLPGRKIKVWHLPITESMKKHLLEKGISKFTHGGFVDKPLYEDRGPVEMQSGGMANKLLMVPRPSSAEDRKKRLEDLRRSAVTERQYQSFFPKEEGLYGPGFTAKEMMDNEYIQGLDQHPLSKNNPLYRLGLHPPGEPGRVVKRHLQKISHVGDRPRSVPSGLGSSLQEGLKPNVLGTYFYQGGETPSTLHSGSWGKPVSHIVINTDKHNKQQEQSPKYRETAIHELMHSAKLPPTMAERLQGLGTKHVSSSEPWVAQTSQLKKFAHRVAEIDATLKRLSDDNLKKRLEDLRRSNAKRGLSSLLQFIALGGEEKFVSSWKKSKDSLIRDREKLMRALEPLYYEHQYIEAKEKLADNNLRSKGDPYSTHLKTQTGDQESSWAKGPGSRHFLERLKKVAPTLRYNEKQRQFLDTRQGT